MLKRTLALFLMLGAAPALADEAATQPDGAETNSAPSEERTEIDRLSDEIRVLQMQNYSLRQQMELLTTQQAVRQLRDTQTERNDAPAMLAVMRFGDQWRARIKTLDGTYYTARVGDRIDGWTVTRISRNGVWGKKKGKTRQFPDVVKQPAGLPGIPGLPGPGVPGVPGAPFGPGPAPTGAGIN